jgi:hypothetical protein
LVPPEDGYRIQYPKRCMLSIKTAWWTVSRNKITAWSQSLPRILRPIMEMMPLPVGKY